MKNINILKTVVGTILAVLIAQLFKLDFPISAGTITMLSILETKRQSLQIALNRLIATSLGLVLASMIYYAFGINLFSYGFILLIFIPIANRFNLSSSIVINAVLISHLLVLDSITILPVVNELILLIIGLSVGLLMNVYIPSIEEDINKSQVRIEQLMKSVLKNFSLNLTNQCGIDEVRSIQELEDEINKGKMLAYQYLNNHFFIDHRYYVEYMEMREKQLFIMKAMNRNLKQVFTTESIPLILSMVTDEVRSELSESNDAYTMLLGLTKIKTDYKTRPLPKTRIEFEERARLYAYYNDLEEFLLVKSSFISKYKEIKYCTIEH